MSKALKTSVLVLDPDGQARLLVPGERLPRWAVKAIGNADVWQDSEEASQEDEEAAPEPEQQSQVESTPEPENAPEKDGTDPEDDDDLIGGAPTAVQKPGGNGSLEEWVAYAKAQGADPAELEGKSRNEIRSLYSD